MQVGARPAVRPASAKRPGVFPATRHVDGRVRRAVHPDRHRVAVRKAAAVLRVVSHQHPVGGRLQRRPGIEGRVALPIGTGLPALREHRGPVRIHRRQGQGQGAARANRRRNRRPRNGRNVLNRHWDRCAVARPAAVGRTVPQPAAVLSKVDGRLRIEGRVRPAVRAVLPATGAGNQGALALHLRRLQPQRPACAYRFRNRRRPDGRHHAERQVEGVHLPAPVRILVTVQVGVFSRIVVGHPVDPGV